MSSLGHRIGATVHVLPPFLCCEGYDESLGRDLGHELKSVGSCPCREFQESPIGGAGSQGVHVSVCTAYQKGSPFGF